MIAGIFAGITWALETVVLGAALGMTPFISTEEAMFLAPLVATFLHDSFSALLTFIYNAVRGNLGLLLSAFRSKSIKWLIIASAIGGPIGMTGYVLAVNYVGASIGAVASAVYPAIGTLLACIFLKERVKWYQWIFLLLTLVGVYALSYSPSINIESFALGILGAFMCAFGWGIEAVVLAKCLKDPSIKPEIALNIRQTVSALIYGIIILPTIGGWGFTASLFSDSEVKLLFTILLAALFATASYLFYYKAIERLGASKAMALNITYTAWAMLFTVVIFRDFGAMNPLSVTSAAVIVICGILAATDVKKLFSRKSDSNNGK